MRADAVPTPLSPARLEQLERELTNDLLSDVRRWAEQRAFVQRRGAVVAFADREHEAEVLVQDAIGLTVLGERQWPDGVPLYTHLCWIVRSLSSDAVKHAKRRAKAGAALDVDDAPGDPDLAAPRTASSRRGLRGRAMIEAVRRVLVPLRMHAGHDPLMTKLLDAYESGCTTRREVIAATSFTSNEYQNARRKLDRVLAKLPEPTLTGVRDAMEITYG